MKTKGGKSRKGRPKPILDVGRSDPGASSKPRVSEEEDRTKGLGEATATGRLKLGDRANSGARSTGAVTPTTGAPTNSGERGKLPTPANGGESANNASVSRSKAKGKASGGEGSGGAAQTRPGHGQGSARDPPELQQGGMSIGQGSSGGRGVSSYSSNHSSQATVSRSMILNWYAAAKQPSHHQQLPLTQPPTRSNPMPHSPAYQPNEEEFHHSLYHHNAPERHPHQVNGSDNQLYEAEDSEDEEQEEDDEMEDAPNLEEQEDYDQMLDDLMALPGRGHLPCLSQHPIPDKETIW